MSCTAVAVSLRDSGMLWHKSEVPLRAKARGWRQGGTKGTGGRRGAQTHTTGARGVRSVTDCGEESAGPSPAGGWGAGERGYSCMEGRRSQQLLEGLAAAA